VPQESLRFAAGDVPQDVLLVGGSLGVFRAFSPAANVEWTQFGTNLPNARVDSIKFISFDPATYENRRQLASDPLLIVGTQGRGAWTLAKRGCRARPEARAADHGHERRRPADDRAGSRRTPP